MNLIGTHGEAVAGGTLRRIWKHGYRVQYFFLLGEFKAANTVVICADCGEIIHLATGLAVAMAFDVYSTMTVVSYFRSQYPDLKIIIAADDYYNDPDNPGMAEATEAALVCGCLMAVPTFNNHKNRYDFTDMAFEQGLEAVRLCIESASVPDEWRGPIC